jgi:2-polyprenyl-6-hydroxyphenyl methylase / 3-demethylubiquinone-9 3-methyltransferase
MNFQRGEYPSDHWIRSHDAQRALAAYMEQQSKAYSRVKNAFVRELLGDLKGKRFLDYGCGGGMFTVAAARLGAAEVVAVDAVDTVLDTARYFARNEGVENLCRFIRSEGFPDSFVQPRFDVILMKDVLEHVRDDQALLNSAARALVAGGILVLSTQNAISLNYLIQGIYRRHLLGDKQWFGWDETHMRFYTPMSLEKKLRLAGFTVKAWRSVYIVPYKLPALPGSKRQFLRIDMLSRVDKALGWIFPYNRLGWNVIVKAQMSPLVKRTVPALRLIAPEISASPLPVGGHSVRLP